MLAYPHAFTKQLKEFVLCTLLIRGGLQVEFSGNVPMVILMAVIPQLCEAFMIAGLCKLCFGMPLEICFALGYMLACISPSIVVPGLISFNERGYGVKKKMASTLIAAGTFEDIIAIVCFSICKTFALHNGGFSGDNHIGWVVAKLFLQNIVSFAFGVGLGLLSWLFKFIPDQDWRLTAKFIWLMSVALGLTLLEWKIHTTEAKYIAALFFGYTTYRLWGKEKPAKHLYWFWFFI